MPVRRRVRCLWYLAWRLVALVAPCTWGPALVTMGTGVAHRWTRAALEVAGMVAASTLWLGLARAQRAISVSKRSAMLWLPLALARWAVLHASRVQALWTWRLQQAVSRFAVVAVPLLQLVT